MQKPGIPAQQMQRTGTRERACGRGTGQNPLAEHAQHAPQPRSIAWRGGGQAHALTSLLSGWHKRLAWHTDLSVLSLRVVNPFSQMPVTGERL